MSTRIGLFLPPGFAVLSFAPLAVFEAVNMTTGQAHYEVTAVSLDGAPVKSSFGMEMATESLGARHFDTLLIGAPPSIVPAAPELLSYLRRCVEETRRVGSICIGAFTLAEAGILDGRRATTHWMFAGELKARYPKINVDMDRIFVADGSVWTSAGMTAGMDLALGMVERDLGREAVRATARTLVLHHRRLGGQSQHSAVLDLDAHSERIQCAIDFARANLRKALTIDELASASHMSRRQFTRIFRKETGLSPSKAIETLRIDAARLMLEQGYMSVEAVVNAAGFGDRERMRRAFLRVSGKTPQQIRNASRRLEST